MKRILVFFLTLGACAAPAVAQSRAEAPVAAASAAGAVDPAASQNSVPLPAGYLIGPDDILHLVFWREKDMSAEVTVRPDGMISVPLVNDVPAAGLTPDQLRERVMESARRYTQDPAVTVVVKQINSRRVYITGEVSKPGPYPLTSPTTVLQLIAIAGGLNEFADAKNIRIMRTEGGRQASYKFDYRSVSGGRNLNQNIDLQPGDTVVVP